ncbi:urease accessory protein UreD [Desulfobacter sp.]|uniref:urease accessory protein UreD n=1 Tax=Desulfobacter sp. TaxID=2294 RepID=UPI00257D812C|nr:urease accessory protein UreD [Desulfobacter sp.]
MTATSLSVEAPVVTEPGIGWEAVLSLTFEARPERTVLGRTRRMGPLTVQQPFYPENDVCHIYLLHPPGGIVGGDRLELDINMEEKTHAMITTPGAAKFYRSSGRKAVVHQKFHLSPGAVLEWFPQETILFNGALADIQTTVECAPGSCFFSWDIMCLGQPARNIRFDTGELTSGLSIRMAGRPVLLDRFHIQGEQDLDLFPGLGGNPVAASFFAGPVDPALFESIRQKHDDPTQIFGITLLDGLLAARYLGKNPHTARRLFTNLWKDLRPVMTGKNICIPRIWNT